MKRINELDVENKKVILRLDYNVPIKDGIVVDNNRIVESLQTIRYLLNKNAKIIIMSHLGKVNSLEDTKTNTLLPVKKELSALLNKEIKFSYSLKGETLENIISNLKPQEILLLENTRILDYPEKLESTCDDNLSQYWASLGDIFVFDAFGSAHRTHASTYGISKYLPHAIGFLVEKELKNLDMIKNENKTVILGGAKVSDKIGVIKNLLETSNKVLIGGSMCATFLKALDYNVGSTFVDTEKINEVKDLIATNKIITPVDVVTENGVKNVTEITSEEKILDIGPKTIDMFKNALRGEKLVLMNGTMGMYEEEKYSKGTKEIFNYLKGAGIKTIVCGGDTGNASKVFNFTPAFLSTGGGASLKYLENAKMPVLEIMEEEIETEDNSNTEIKEETPETKEKEEINEEPKKLKPLNTPVLNITPTNNEDNISKPQNYSETKEEKFSQNEIVKPITTVVEDVKNLNIPNETTTEPKKLEEVKETPKEENNTNESKTKVEVENQIQNTNEATSTPLTLEPLKEETLTSKTNNEPKQANEKVIEIKPKEELNNEPKLNTELIQAIDNSNKTTSAPLTLEPLKEEPLTSETNNEPKQANEKVIEIEPKEELNNEPKLNTELTQAIDNSNKTTPAPLILEPLKEEPLTNQNNNESIIDKPQSETKEEKPSQNEIVKPITTVVEDLKNLNIPKEIKTEPIKSVEVKETPKEVNITNELKPNTEVGTQAITNTNEPTPTPLPIEPQKEVPPTQPNNEPIIKDENIQRIINSEPNNNVIVTTQDIEINKTNPVTVNDSPTLSIDTEILHKKDKLIVLNQKCLLNYNELKDYSYALETLKSNYNIVLFPNLAYLSHFYNSPLTIGTQNFYNYKNGSYTGEVSLEALKEMGINYTLVGHPERITLKLDTYSAIKDKLFKSLSSGFNTILCVCHDEKKSTLKKELKYYLKGITEDSIKNLIIAFEPSAKIDGDEVNVNEIKFVSSYVKEYFNKTFNKEVKFIYGGGVTPENINEIISITDGIVLGKNSKDINVIRKILQVLD